MLEKPGDSFVEAEIELHQTEILSKDAGTLLLSLLVFFSYFCHTLVFIYKQLWSALEIAYIFKSFLAQICLTFA